MYIVSNNCVAPTHFGSRQQNALPTYQPFFACPHKHYGSDVLLYAIFNYNTIATDMNVNSKTPDSGDCQNSTYLYASTGHVITGNLNDIPVTRERSESIYNQNKNEVVSLHS